jgi:hypothetical protein
MGPGVDPTFDQLVSALGHIARQKPKPLIDTIMHWRKHKSEEASTLRAKLATVGGHSCFLETLADNSRLD